MNHILLIDDNSFFSATFSSLLQRAGYEVTAASSYEEAKGFHEETPSHLVIIGLYLKGKNGEKSLTALRETFADARLIALLCESDKREIYYPLVMKELKGRRIFYKPFKTEEILEAIYEELAPPVREAAC